MTHRQQSERSVELGTRSHRVAHRSEIGRASKRNARAAWSLALGLLLAPRSSADDEVLVVEIGRPVTITIRREDPPLDAQGPSRRCRCIVNFDGVLHVFALTPDGDPYLRLESTTGTVGEDDDSGGGTTPYLDREVSTGDEFTIVVAVELPPELASVDVELHVESSPETDETRIAAEVALRRLNELGSDRSASNGELRGRIREILDDLLAVPGARASRLATGAAARIGYQAYRLGAFSVTCDGLAVNLERGERIRPPDDPRVQSVRGDLGAAFEDSGDLERASELKTRAYESLARTVPDDDVLLQFSRVQLAVLRYKQFRFEEAVPLLRTALEHLVRLRPQTDDAIVKARTQLGRSLWKLGDAADAIEAFETIIATPGLNQAALLGAKLEVAKILKDSGDLQRARALQQSILAESEQMYPEDHPLVADAMIHLATTLSVMGDYPASKVLLERRVAALERFPPDDLSLLRGTRSDLGVVLMLMNQHERARQIHQDLVDELETLESVDEGELIHRLAVLATTISAMGRMEEAIPMQRRVDEAWTRWFGPDDQNRLSNRLNFAISLMKTGSLDEAWDVAHDVLERRERILPPGDAMLQRALNVNLMVAIRDGDHDVTVPLSERVIAAVVRGISDAMLVLSPREAEQVAGQRGSGIALVLGYARTIEDERLRQRVHSVVWPAIEASRSAATTSRRLAREISATLAADVAEELTNAIVAARFEVASAASAGKPERVVAATSHLEAAERALRERLTGRLRFAAPRMEELQAAVPEDAAAVSYWAYPDELGGNTRRMVAMVLRRDRGPSVFDLGTQGEINHAVDAWRGSIRVDVARARPIELGPNSSAGTRADATSSGDVLRRIVFDPLRAAIGDAKRLIVIPDDALHLIPFEALPDDVEDGRYVGDRFAIEYRTSLTDRLDPNEDSAATRESDLLLLGGGIDFGPTGESGGFVDLPATSVEVDAIARLRRETLGEDAAIEVLSGSDATKERLLALLPRASYLHLATHGEFGGDDFAVSSESTNDDVVRGFAPLALCGVALSDANVAANDLGQRVGILTGEEIAAIDLSGCELAVLSACETNVGERRPGQGIASLQTALRAAGARTTITSLWRVPDEETRALMVEFYRRVWVEKQPKAQALWEAKKTLRERGASLAGWAAWVMNGDPD